MFTIAGTAIAVTIGAGGWVSERRYARRARALAVEARHPSVSELDPLIHAPKRLRITAILDAAQVEFSYLQERVEISPPDLSKQMKQLVDSGYVKADKTGRGPGAPPGTD